LLVRTLAKSRSFQPPPPPKTAKLGKLKGMISEISYLPLSHHPQIDS
jgi:hypothetical protein